MLNFQIKDNYNIDDLIQVMTALRSEQGCAWDKVQTHESIKKNLIEETYEVIEAINKNDTELLKEELGDVLLQVVFHSQMADEVGKFDFTDVADGICKKLVQRHPHVFGDINAETSEQALDSWDEVKRKTKGQKTQGDSMIKVPKELPALMRSQKIQAKAKKAGFDWDDMSGAFDALSSEIDELKEAIEIKSHEDVKDEFGDVLFSAVNIARFIDVDSEEALSMATDKFVSRYLIVEKLAKEKGIDMKSTPIEVLDELWKQAKQIIASN